MDTQPGDAQPVDPPHQTVTSTRAWYDRRGLRWLRFLRLELERKTDILAAAAFFISIGGILYQIFLFTRGADVIQFPPEQIVFYPDTSGTVDYINSGAAVSYVNKGKGDKSAVIKAERFIFSIAGRTYELRWQNFVDYSSKGNQLVIENAKPAVPAVVKSGEAITHETHFAPRSLPTENGMDRSKFKNYLAWNTFVTELEKVKELDVRIVSELYDMKDKETNVYIQVTPVMIQSLKNNKWYASSCWLRRQ